MEVLAPVLKNKTDFNLYSDVPTGWLSCRWVVVVVSAWLEVAGYKRRWFVCRHLGCFVFFPVGCTDTC